jgi:competence protein ComEA
MNSKLYRASARRKAEAIVEYRKQHGNFKSVEELKNVKGIGESLFNRLQDGTIVPAV